MRLSHMKQFLKPTFDLLRLDRVMFFFFFPPLSKKTRSKYKKRNEKYMHVIGDTRRKYSDGVAHIAHAGTFDLQGGGFIVHKQAGKCFMSSFSSR